MPAPNDLNSRIALAKGWRRVAYDDNRFHRQPFYWVDSANVIRGEQSPDYVGTLEGVSGMLQELGNHSLKDRYDGCDTGLFWTGYEWVCGMPVREGDWGWAGAFSERAGIAVAEAWLFVFGKEATDG